MAQLFLLLNIIILCLDAYKTHLSYSFCVAVTEGAINVKSSAYMKWLRHTPLRLHPDVILVSSVLRWSK